MIERTGPNTSSRAMRMSFCTPPKIVALLNAEINRALKSPALVQRFAAAGLDAAGNKPEEFSRQIREEVAKWRKVVAAANIKVD